MALAILDSMDVELGSKYKFFPWVSNLEKEEKLYQGGER